MNKDHINNIYLNFEDRQRGVFCYYILDQLCCH